MSNIRIDIASEFKDKGFKAAEKRTTSLNRKFDNLTRSAKRTFVAIAGFQALRKSVEAFAAEDRAAQKLATTLRNLGLAYNTKAIEAYLESSEKATTISKDELSPAIAQLITTTLNAEKSMNLLAVAMDISTGTTRDLQSVTTALSRAYNGNFTALGRLQTAYTTAELEAMGFEKAIAALGKQYSGAAQRNAETYAGKIDALKIAFGDVAEEIGKGIVAFLTSLGNGNYDNGLQKLVNFGSAIGDVFRRAGVSFEYLRTLLSTGLRIDEEEMRRLDEIRQRFNNPQAAENRRANSPSANRQFLADYRKQQQLNKKIEDERKKSAARTAKLDRERAKREREALSLKRAGTIFDMENIQVVAALQGKIDGEQRLRLVTLLALQTANAEVAEKLANAVLALNAPALANLGVIIKSGDNVDQVIKKLLDSQTKIALLNLGIKDIPKAKNPFEDWDTILDRLLDKVKNLKTAITSIGGTSTPQAGGAAGGVSAGGGQTVISANPTDPTGVVISTPSGTASPFDNFNVGGATIIANSGTVQSAQAGDTVAESNARQRIADIFATIGQFGAGGFNPSNVTVNVAGTVISNTDLVQAITEGLYEVQKRGQSITLNAIAI